MMKSLCALFTLLMLSSFAGAQIYTWTDANGKTHYSDKPPTHSQVNKASLPSLNSMKPSEYQPTLAPSSGKKVVMYSTSWCGYCRKARAYFKDNGIAFTEKDIETNSRAKKEYDRLNGTGVPLIMVGKTRIQGFNLSQFKQAYY